jgi:hypothetical protein
MSDIYNKMSWIYYKIFNNFLRTKSLGFVYFIFKVEVSKFLQRTEKYQ